MSSKILKGLFLTCMVIALFSFDVPKGWFKAGTDPNKYNMGLEFGMGMNSKYAATIQSNSNRINGFGTLMQNFSPDKYRGKKIRMTGYMKSVDVDSWAGFWLRVDGENKRHVLSFDNMQNRPVRGTTNWAKYDIVLDVPENASNIAFGALLAGTGKIWFDDIKFEEAGPASRITGRKTMDQDPQNLNFEQ